NPLVNRRAPTCCTSAGARPVFALKDERQQRERFDRFGRNAGSAPAGGTGGRLCRSSAVFLTLASGRGPARGAQRFASDPRLWAASRNDRRIVELAGQAARPLRNARHRFVAGLRLAPCRLYAFAGTGESASRNAGRSPL